jgi:hypothetical protein
MSFPASFRDRFSVTVPLIWSEGEEERDGRGEDQRGREKEK